MEEIEELIGITGIHRMEAYDISNTNGYESVASMIVYEDGKPKVIIIESLELSLLRVLTIMPA